MSNEEKKELYGRWLLELWNGNTEMAEEIVNSQFVGHWPAEDVNGPQELVEMVQRGRQPFNDLTFEIEIGPIVEGDLVAARWVGRGAYAGGIPGASASAGEQVTFRGSDFVRVQSGRIVEYWVSSDGLHLMSQLGVISAS